MNLKGLSYDQTTHDLTTGAQCEQAYLTLNPQGIVPALEAPGGVLIQSPAILEWLIGYHGRSLAFGDMPTFADCYLIPQVCSAQRFGLDLEPYPHIRGVCETTTQIGAFIDAHPNRQPDAEPG